MAHSQYGGSVIKRVIKCPGSVALCASVPKKPGGPAALEGSFAHKVAEYCLTDGRRTAFALVGEELPFEARAKLFAEDDGKLFAGMTVTPDMATAVDVYLDAVAEEMAKSKDAEFYVEHSFQLDIASAEPGEVYGQNDCMVYHPSLKRLAVFDYKHGVGVSVDVEANEQLQFYAAGAVFSHPDWAVVDLELIIVQPRARDVDEVGAVKRWPMDVVSLFDFLATVDSAVERSKSYAHDVVEEMLDGGVKDATLFQTGDHCRWCDAAAVCPAREAEVLQGAQLNVSSIAAVTIGDLPAPNTLDLSALAPRLAGLRKAVAWLNQIEEYIEALVINGTPVKGFKAVEKIGRAKWVSADEEVAAYAQMLFGVNEEHLRPRKLCTITDAEKLLKAAGASKNQIDDFKLKFTIKESSGLTLALDSDKRPAVDPLANSSLNLTALET